MDDLVEKVRKAVGDTQLMVPGTLRDLLCSSSYANDHVIALLLRNVATNAIRAMLDAIAEPSEAMQERGAEEISGNDSFPFDFPGEAIRVWRAMIAALRKELGQ